MLRGFARPAIAVGAKAYGILGYGGYRLLKPTTETQVEMVHALEGDIAAQKHAAGCFSQGHCPGLGQAPVLGCAWRRVIADGTGHAPDAEREAAEACARVGPALEPVVGEAKRDIEARMPQMKPRPHKR